MKSKLHNGGHVFVTFTFEVQPDDNKHEVTIENVNNVRSLQEFHTLHKVISSVSP